MLAIQLAWFEIQDQFKSWIFWLLSWTAVAAMIAGVYQSFADEQEEFQSVLENTSPELLSAFNIRIDYLSSVELYSTGEFLTFFSLVGCIYAAIYGSALLSGKIQQKTLWSTFNTSISRIQLSLVYSIVAGLLWLIASFFVPLVLMLFLTLLTDQSDISLSFFVSMGLASFLLQVCFVYLGSLLSLVLGKASGTGLSAGLAAGLWFVHSFGSIDGFPEWVKPLTPFYYFDISYFAENMELDWSLLGWLPVLALVLLVLQVLRFKQMDIDV